MTNPLYSAAVNNAILDPLQGYDASVWAQDQATGNYLLVGSFTSIQITISNATEPYLEFNQRSPRYLDGEIQIGWVMERGQLDSRILQQTFGISEMTRQARLNRMPRFQITLETNAPDLDDGAPALYPDAGRIGNGEIFIPQTTTNVQAARFANRKTRGQLVLEFCKVDSFTMGATAGRTVIANRWVGLAEGIKEVDRSYIWAGTNLGGVAAEDALNQDTIRLGDQNFGRPSGVNVDVDINIGSIFA